MSFLNPLLLFGIAAVAVPIIIHLLNRRKFRKIDWAAMKFVKLSIDQNQRRMRLEDLILLLLRCALLALLALALARPVMRQSESSFMGQAGVTSVLVLDNSFSMGLEDGEATRFERAKEACTNILDSLPSGSSVALYLGSDVVRPVIEEPVFDLDAVREGVASAPLSDHATALFPSVERAVSELEGSSSVRREVYVVTDNQELGWRQSALMQKLLEKHDRDIRVHFVVVGGEGATDNLGITALSPAEGLVTVDKPVRINVAVRNFSDREQKAITVSLRVGDANGTVSDVFIPALEAGSTQAFPFLITLDRPGLHTVRATIMDGDRLPADNHRSIVINALKQIRILVINGDPKDDLDKDETRQLEEAMAPAARDKKADFYVRTVTRHARVFLEAESQVVDWPAYRLVVLANVKSLPSGIVEQLARYVGAGNGLLVFPGSEIDEAFYNDELHKRLALLPASFGGARGDASQAEVFTTLQSANYEHSVVEMWNNPEISLGGRKMGARFFRRQLLQLPRALARSQLEERSGQWYARGEEESYSGWVVGDEGAPAERYQGGEKVDLAEDEIGLPKVVLSYDQGRHKLVAGEKLAKVATDYGVSLESLETLNPNPLTEGDEVVLPAGQPAVVEHSWGLGRVYQFSYTADTDWSKLPASPHSVPLYDKIIGSILLNQDAGLNLVVGNPFTRELGAVNANLQARIIAPGQAADQAETLIVSTESGQGTLRFGDTDRAGIYEVIYEYPDDSEETTEPPAPVRFATQPDTRESNMTALSPATRKTMDEHAGLHDWPQADLTAALKRDRVGAEFWLPIILIVLLFGALEIWLAQKFSRPK